MHRLLLCQLSYSVVLSCGLDSKESACNLIDLGFTRESGGSPGDGNNNRFQYSSLENTMDSGAWKLQSMISQKVRHN